MKNKTCNGCLTQIRQGFTDIKNRLFCTQSCEQDFNDNGEKPVKKRRQHRGQ